MMDQAPDHAALNQELSAELLDLRGRLLTANKQVQLSGETANSLSARLDEAAGLIREDRKARIQAEGDLAVLKESIPPLHARIALLEGYLRSVADSLKPVHEQAQALRPE